MAKKVIVDVSATGGPNRDFALAQRQAGIALIEEGKEEEGVRVIRGARELLQQSRLPSAQIEDLTPEEEQQRELDQVEGLNMVQQSSRMQRNSLLSASDWTQIADAALTDEQRTAWRTYRQTLRDLDFSDPNNIDWPEPPT